MRDTERLGDYGNDEKMQWVKGRETTLKEDMSYCLFGILDVAIGANYGEGQERAHRRLRAAAFDECYHDLRTVPVAADASYDSFAERSFDLCLPGTRVGLISQILDWASNANSKPIFWLCGKAGTGTSTISRTIAHRLDKQLECLGASFFFRRGEGDRGNGRRFFPTIAKQLARKIPGMRRGIVEAVSTDACDKNIDLQFEWLIFKPLRQLHGSQWLGRTQILIIDAIDECDNSDDINSILTTLARESSSPSLRLRIFVTSRPELPVELGFRKMDSSLHQDVLLEEAQQTTIAQDIHAYITHRINEIKENDRLTQVLDPLPMDWPGEPSVQVLADLACPLFITASTMCPFISDADPQECLATLLRQGRVPMSTDLERMYRPILEIHVLCGETHDRLQALAGFRQLVGSIVLLAEPLSAQSLSNLLQISVREIDRMLRRLISVLSLPKSTTAPIRVFHSSFRDFLQDKSGESTNPFKIDEAHTHSRLVDYCVRLLSKPGILKQDICNVKMPGTRRAGMSKQKIDNAITSDIAYACKYWVWHLAKSGEKMLDGGLVHCFLKVHLLHWIEVACWLGRLSAVITQLNILQSLIQTDDQSQLYVFLEDAVRFVLQARHIADVAPLQLYSSALELSPTESIVRHCFDSQRTGCITLLVGALSHWGKEAQKLEAHKNEVNAVAFSSDGRTLASASGDMTVLLWDTLTGEKLRSFEGHEDWVNAVSFSPDGDALATSSIDHTARLWDVSTGSQMQVLAGHDDWVNAVAYAPLGQLVVTASRDRSVRLWDARIGKEIRKLEGHKDWVRSAIFSPDGCMVASSANDRTIRLWYVDTGEIAKTLEGHEEWVNAVSFSADGKSLASASGDATVRIWNVESGQTVHQLRGHADWVNSVAFSPSGEALASASHDNSIRLWDTETGQEINQLQGHDDWVNDVVFSPRGNTLASASGDRTVRIWDINPSRDIPDVREHEEAVTAVDLSPDGKLFASASWTPTVKLWDIERGVQVQSLEGHSNSVWALTFSTSGHTLASASSDQTIRLWNTSTGEETKKLEGFDGWVNALALSPDGQRLASALSDRTVIIWDVASTMQLLSLKTSNSIGRVWFSDDGNYLKTNIGDFELTTRLHKSLSNDLVTTALHLSGRWIRYKDVDLLWLPHGYRGTCWASNSKHLLIGQFSGMVSLFKFDTSRVPGGEVLA